MTNPEKSLIGSSKVNYGNDEGSDQLTLLCLHCHGRRRRPAYCLTTALAHACRGWNASHWPVCAAAKTTNPPCVGAALTYARRYGLVWPVVAGEDDIDTPNLLSRKSPRGQREWKEQRIRALQKCGPS